MSPWKYLYSFLIYAVTIPGLFAISLSIYLFFFERGSIMDANIFTQVLPIISMLLTISIIRKTVDLDLIPGFNKLSSLMLVISIVCCCFGSWRRPIFLSLLTCLFGNLFCYCGSCFCTAEILVEKGTLKTRCRFVFLSDGKFSAVHW